MFDIQRFEYLLIQSC